MGLSPFSRYFPLILVLHVSVHFSFASVITVDDNGYRGIVVAIHKSVPEDPEILENIKTLFTRASNFLYNSTKNSVYFKEVTIVVPSTWSLKPEYEVLPGNFFSSAHIRVDSPNPEYKDTPYTVQPGACGEPGQYIHLTPWFLKELERKTVEMFGAPERQLVHEWAHLRYGVFDEYGMPGNKRFPMFYSENGRIRPTSCVRDIKGWIESRDGGPCKMNNEGDVDSDCIFIPNMHSNEAKASIMYMPFIPSMEGFCDDDSHKHNIFAPTKHNALCNYRSTWDVISSHPDFQKRTKRDATSELTETLFRVLQSPKNPTSRYVLVLDVSGSMNGQPIKLLHSAATRLVEDRVEDGTYLGIVQFSTEARILHNLTKVDNITRKQLSQSLPYEDDKGLTAIGKGLQEAINVLKYGNGTAEGGLIMLITDGEENITPFIEDVLPEVLQHNVIINAVAFGSDASQKLESMTKITGGRGYFFSNNGSRPASALDSAFLESITSQADIEIQPVQLKDEMFTLDKMILTKHVYIDEELGKQTIFTITSPHIQRIADVVLRSPTGDMINSSSPHYDREDHPRQRIQIVLPQADPGKWEVIIRRVDEYPIIVNFAVTSEAKDIRDQPIRAKSWLNEIQLKFPAHAKVYAEVKKGYMAVVGATVTATVERPMGPTVDVDLRDDGLGADVTENDGIYTAYFTHFNGNGRYAVIARVTNDGQARLKLGSAGSSSPAMYRRSDKSKDLPPSNEFSPEDFEPSDANKTEDEDLDLDTKPASKFDRASNSGAFRLDSWTPLVGDVIPPGDIMDLRVVSSQMIEDGRYTVSLEFTVPGDDLDTGTVDSLELRTSLNKMELITDFESGLEINNTSLVNGTLDPQEPGYKSSLTVSVPDSLVGNESDPWSVYFAIKAKDETGKESSKYNVVGATFGIKVRAIRRPSVSAEESTEKAHMPPIDIEPDDTYELKNASEIFPGVGEAELTSAENEGGSNEDEITQSNGNNSFRWWPVIVGVGVALTVLMIVALIAVVIIKKIKTKTYSSVQSEQC